jgi:hypothetical protein
MVRVEERLLAQGKVLESLQRETQRITEPGASFIGTLTILQSGL